MNEAITPRTITLRELCDEGVAIMDAVEAGETLLVTRDGIPVARLSPIMHKRKLIPTAELRRIFAASPSPDYGLMRAEIDAYFGEDRIGDDE